MKAVSYYHKDTGEFHPATLYTTDSGGITLNCPPEHIPMDGQFDARKHRVDTLTRKVVNKDVTADQALLAHLAVKAKQRATLAEIQRIERDEQPRALRECVLGMEGSRARLIALEAQVTLLRTSLTVSSDAPE